jgi:uncharacterized lipoprotein YmbA
MKPGGGFCLPLLVCAACSSGPPTLTYVLVPPLAPQVLALPVASPSERVIVRRVLVPDYLDTTDILLRDGPNGVKASVTGRWGERLSQGLTQALAADLAARLPGYAVMLDMPATAQRQVQIRVNALDLWRDGRCAIAATWTIVDHDAPHAVEAGSGTFESSALGSGVDDARLVDAMSRTLNKLADAIAVGIRQSYERSALAAP